MPASSPAALGGLTTVNCIADFGGGGCAGAQQGLSGAYDVAASADGKSLYAVGQFDSAIVRFDRDPATGALTPQGCIQDVGKTECGVYEQGLDEPTGVAISPDGKSVYVSSAGLDHAIVRFDRDTETGELTGAGCKQSAAATPDCGGGANTVAGLTNANDVAVSADSKSVYVVSLGGGGFAGAIVRFDRNTVSEPGTLTPQGCFAAPATVDCAGTQQGLGEPYNVAASPDGKSVYVASRVDGAIVRFDRDANGALAPQGCFGDVGGTDCGIGNSAQGLAGALSVAVSPDNTSVYVGSGGDNALVRFGRNTGTGALTSQGCIADVPNSAGCGAAQGGLSRAYAIAVSPDSRSVYVLGDTDHAIVNFDRDPGTTALATQQSFTTLGLGAPSGGAVSPDGHSFYVAAWGSNNLFRFFRETSGSSTPPPETPVPPSPTPARPPFVDNEVKVASAFKRPNNGTITYSFDLPGGGAILVHADGRVTAPARAWPPNALGALTRRITIAQKKVTTVKAGIVKVTLKPKKFPLSVLKRKGKLKARVRITYTPTGGTPKTIERSDTFLFKTKRKKNQRSRVSSP
ncbi:MAG TPA: beta-propeller fold lactonase family protein [Solirubrobacterales bacterium]